MPIKNLWNKYISRHKPLIRGLYHYRGQEGGIAFRLHLRIEPDARGLLVINASKVLHLNQTAAEMARHLIEGDDSEKAVAKMLKRYWGVKKEQLLKDFTQLRDNIKALATTDDICPVSYLDIQRIEPFSTPVSAPYRMDLALTYDCDNSCGHCYLPRDRKPKELTTGQWKQVIAKLWDIGIPHVCFTGGEATLRPDLADLIAFAEETGLVSGLLTNGRRMKDHVLVQQMVDSGIDHFQITLESHDPGIHDVMVGRPGAWRETIEGIRNAVASPVYTITNTTITKRNAAGIEKTIEFIRSLGISTFACNGLIYSGQGAECGDGYTEAELEPILRTVHDQAHRLGMKFIWYTPTRYCNLNPVELGLGIKSCTAAKYNMCVETDGAVIPCQSWFEPLGNILTDDWKTIWNAVLARELRERKNVPDKCLKCAELPSCGGGCPIYNRQNQVLCIDSKSNG